MCNLQNAKRFALCFILCLMAMSSVEAQTTEFTYQGRLVDGSLPANTPQDFEFRLFAAETGGTALGTQTRLGVPVSNGIFTVRLDFAGQFDGPARWLEISVKPAGDPNPFTLLNPRQPVSSAPYSIRSLNAGTAVNSLNLGGVAANQYVITTDTRLSDARDPLPGSGSYIQNSIVQQPVSNFNISGNGAANLFNAATFYNIGGSRVLSIAGGDNIFAGVNAGSSNTFGFSNAFFGRDAGRTNTTGFANSFFGNEAGDANLTGGSNSFFGSRAGQTSTASDNSFFGAEAGFLNTTGTRNSFLGRSAGRANTTSSNNSFFGYNAGAVNTAGNNSFFGSLAGDSNTTGSLNSFFGTEAGTENTTSNDNSFFGYRAGFVNTAFSNSFFGSQAGVSNTTGQQNSFFGRSAGTSNTTGSANSFFGYEAGDNSSGENNTFVGRHAGFSNSSGSNNTAIGSGADVSNGNLTFATVIGSGASINFSNGIVIGRSADRVRIDGDLTIIGTTAIIGLSTGGNTDICRNGSGQISQCSSSLRYKTDVQSFTGGLDIVRSLRPISFNWKDGGMRDVGFGAEEVNEIEPLLVTYNDKGEIEGVKYGQVTTVLVNAVNEQQAQIAEQQRITERQQQQLKQQQSLLEALKRSVCASNPIADVCKQ